MKLPTPPPPPKQRRRRRRRRVNGRTAEEYDVVRTRPGRFCLRVGHRRGCSQVARAHARRVGRTGWHDTVRGRCSARAHAGRRRRSCPGDAVGGCVQGQASPSAAAVARTHARIAVRDVPTGRRHARTDRGDQHGGRPKRRRRHHRPPPPHPPGAPVSVQLPSNRTRSVTPTAAAAAALRRRSRRASTAATATSCHPCRRQRTRRACNHDFAADTSSSSTTKRTSNKTNSSTVPKSLPRTTVVA